MVKIIPTYECVLETRRKPEDVSRALRLVTEAPKKNFFDSSHGEFSGLIEDQKFKIWQNIDYHNSFLPIIEGSVEENETGSIITIKMAMHPFVQVFVFFFIFGSFSGFLSGLYLAITGDFANAWLMILSPVFVIVFEKLLMRIGFFSPAKKAIVRLKELLFCYDQK